MTGAKAGTSAVRLLCALVATASLLLAMLPSVVFAAGGEPIVLRKTYSGNIRYVAIGASFRNQPNSVNQCSFVSPMQRTVNLDIPVGAEIVEAYLYYAGGADVSGHQGGNVIDLDDQTNLRLNGVLIPVTAGFNDRDFNYLTGVGSGNVDFFGARRDVSDIVTGPGAYTLTGLVHHTEAMGRTTTGTCLAAFAIIFVYKDPSVTRTPVINLFDGFVDLKNSVVNLVPENFVVATTSPGGKITHMTYEGDDTVTGIENFSFQVGTGGTQDKTNSLNPANEQYNNTVTGPDVFDTNTTYGFDLDTYDISSQLAGQPSAYTAQANLETGGDLIVFMGGLISIDNKDLADIEVTMNDIGVFASGTADSAQYLIHVKNNGDGTTNPGTGFATGYVHLYNDLPAGISISSLSDVTAPGWDCSSTNVGTGQVRCTYNLATLPGGQLNRGDALPDVLIVADVATPASPVTSRARVTLCNNNPDTCTTFNAKHTDADQFDPVNYFLSSQSIFDVLSKTATNNNVSAVVTPIVAGTPSNLSTSTKAGVDLNGGLLQAGDTVQYTILVNESAGVPATGVTISDAIDTDTNSFSFVSATGCGSPSNSYVGGVLTVTNVSVAANATCTIVYNTTVRATATPGTKIDNTATIDNGNGVDGTATAPTLLVYGTATGQKALYLTDLNTGSRKLVRTVPVSDTSSTINTGQNRLMTLTPVLYQDVDINAGVASASVWVQANTTGNYSLTAELSYQGGTVIGTSTISGVAMTSGLANAQLFPFQFNIPAPITGLDAGENIRLRVTNSGGSAGSVVIHSLQQGINSKLVIPAANVVNVDNITFYSDVARTNVVTSVESGQTIYVEADVSDPFGDFDITSATLTLIDPNLANQLTDAPMTADAGPADALKTFSYAWAVPLVTSIDPGTWIAQVTAHEGTEGSVSHTDSDTFTATAPQVTIDYDVNVLTANPSDTLTYTLTITNGGGAATVVDVDPLAIPAETQNLVIVNSGGGNASGSTASTLDIQSIPVPASSSVNVVFTVDVMGGAVKGDVINHTMTIDNAGIILSNVASSVLVSPLTPPTANKFLYLDNLSTSMLLDRTAPALDSNTTIASQGGSVTIVMSPVTQSSLTLKDLATPGTPDIETSVWISRSVSFAGERSVKATLGYTGASTGTIGSDTVTLTLDPGAANGQFVPFQFDLPSDLVLLPNTSLTLKIENDTAISGETITVHSIRSGEPSKVSFTAITPLQVDAVEFFDNDIDLAGNQITDAAPGATIWVRATVSDPFGSADITAANLTITSPSAAVTLNNAAMNVPATQPVSGAQKYFQLSHTLTGELGDWTASVLAKEGAENLVTASGNALINANNLNPDLSDSYKYVMNTSSGENSNTNAGDTLHYTVVLVESGGTDASSVSVDDSIPAGTTFVPGTLTVDSIVQADPSPDIALAGLVVPANGTVTIEFDVTVDGPGLPGTVISNSADITNPNGSVTAIQVNAEDIVLSGSPASGTKVLYLENLNTGSPYLTRTQPQTPGTGDSIVLQNSGGSVSLDLTPPLAADITIDPGSGDIPVSLRMEAVGQTFRSRSVTVELSYHNGGTPIVIGSVTQNAFLFGSIFDYVFNIPVAATTTIPAGYQLRLTVTNNQAQTNRDLQLYSYDSASNYSSVSIVPDHVINVDGITFWTDTMGAGTQTANPNPTTDIDVYAKVVISDPFGDYDIQAPDAPTNPTTISVVDPDNNATLSGSTSCTAPCYAYDGEDTVNDPPGDGTRTFYFIVRINSSPPATRGIWTATVTANEGLEAGAVSHVSAGSFNTSLGPNLATSTKAYTNVGDIDPGDTLTYVITLNNSGGIDADNVSLSDTLQSSPVALTFSSASTTCTDETASALPNPSEAGGVVTLSNISVTAGGSCTVTIKAIVGAGTPGDLIDNQAIIVNPGGAGGTPSAQTILLSASQVPVAGSKQLYLDGIGGSSILTRTPPTSTSQTTLVNGGGSTQLTLASAVTRAMTIDAGPVDVHLYLSETGNGSNRAVRVDLQVDPDGAGPNPFQTIDFVQQTISLSGTATLYTLNLNNASQIAVSPGALFRITVTNNQAQNNRNVILYQVASAPYSEIVVPMIGSIEVTDIKFFDVSGNDSGGCAPNCGTQIDPALVQTNDSIWLRTTIADGFGASDVNTGCDGVTTTNCPSIIATDPNANDYTGSLATNILSYLSSPDASSRRYEIEIQPGAGMDGLEGVWTVQVTGNEGTEGLIADTAIETFERYGPPEVLLTKSAAGTPKPNSVLTYTLNVHNVGTGPAIDVVLTQVLASFLDMELVASGGSWTALDALTGGYTVGAESFDDGSGAFTYDPTSMCGAAIPANSPCYDHNVKKWRLQLVEAIPAASSLDVKYKARIE
ncbi:MAG: DUF11 domain-containing protein [Pseudomonadales bacterium]|nr:DUF11 domain-containing protein [Pseudomonadales bacterium]